MDIVNCLPDDLEQILALYQAARDLQTARHMVVWPQFNIELIKNEIKELRQFKFVIDGKMACNWVITFRDKEIWEQRDQNDAVYIHRICVHPAYRGLRFIDHIVEWAIQYASANHKKYVRLDTLGNNTRLIQHYTSAGFDFLGIYLLTNTAGLPKHYQDEPHCCLFELKAQDDED